MTRPGTPSGLVIRPSIAVEESSRTPLPGDDPVTDFAAWLERCRVERALWALDRRTAGRELTRSERRLRAHYLRVLEPAAESGTETPEREQPR